MQFKYNESIFAAARGKDDIHRGINALQLLGKQKPIHIPHMDIKKGHLAGSLRRKGQCRLPAAEAENLCRRFCLFDGIRQSLRREFFVIYR